MSDAPEALSDLLDRVERRERAIRHRVVLFSVVPVLLAAALLWFTGQRIQSANRELAGVEARLSAEGDRLRAAESQSAQLQQQLQQTQAEIERSNRELEAIREKLRHAERDVAQQTALVESYRRNEANLRARADQLSDELETLTRQMGRALNFQPALFPGNVAISSKYILSMYPRQGEILMDTLGLRDQGVSWKLGGLSPSEGFDSPSLVAFLLEKHHLLTAPAASVRYRLAEVLPRVDTPRVGDVVVYPAGYTLFYFVDEQNRPFVLGMTPFGVLALRPDFAKPQGYLRVSYRP